VTLKDFTKDEASMQALVDSGDLVAIFYNLGDNDKARVEWPGCMVGQVVYYGESRGSKDLVFKFDPTEGTKAMIKKARRAKNNQMRWNISKTCEYELQDMHVVAIFSEIPPSLRARSRASTKRSRPAAAANAEPRRQSLYDSYTEITAQAERLAAGDNRSCLRRRTRGHG
jgi:hypothetical protein